MKKLIRVAVFITLLIVVMMYLNKVYTVKKIGHVNDWSNSSTVANFYNEVDDSIDVLFFGTSTASNGVQPAVIWNENRITSYNFSTEQQFSIAAYYLLMEALEYQTPKVVVINAKWVTTRFNIDDQPVGTENRANVIDDSNGFLHYSLDYLRLSKAKVRAAFDIASRSDTQSFLDYIFPLYRYHERNDISNKDFNFKFLSDQHKLKGSSVQLITEPMLFNGSRMQPVDDVASWDYSGLSPTYVAKMIQLCKENNIEVLLLSLPIGDWDWQQHQAVKAFSEMHEVNYLDMNQAKLMSEMQISTLTDFQSLNHENVLGACKTSKYLAKYLERHYNFDREYPNEVVESFNNSYQAFMDYKSGYEAQLDMVEISSLRKYLYHLSQSDDYIVVIAARDEFSASLSQKDKQALKSLGLCTDFDQDIYRYSYLALIDSGNVIYEECSPYSLEFSYKTSDGITFNVKSAGLPAGNTSSICVADNEYSVNARGLNIVVFNKTFGYVIDTVNFDTFEGLNGYRPSTIGG